MKRQPDWPVLFLLIAILFGGMVRFMPALVTRFPLNDGGMFYTMTQELSSNGYILPATTSYNGLNLPYAYPPFGLYLASLLADVGRIPLLEVFLWLPAFLSLLAIPAFYLLARALLADNLSAALAAIFFALTPGRYDWHIMGGGVTRAAGMLFLLLAAFHVLRLFRSQEISDSASVKRRSAKSPDFVFAILFCSLAVLSHPEVGLQTAGLCFVLWLFLGRTWRGILDACFVALGVILLTSSWWGAVLAHHGLAPFLSAVQTGQHTATDWPSLFLSLFASGEFLPLLLLLRLAGFLYAVWKKQYLLVVLVFTPALFDPRSAASIAHLSLSMLAAFGFLDVLPALMKKIRSVEIRPILTYRAGAITVFTLAFMLFLECGLLNFRLVNTTLTADERAVMAALETNLSADQNFIIITGRTYSMSDPVQEWFPTLTGHHSQTTLQGLEWTLGADFTNRLDDLAALQSCADLACVESWSTRTGLMYDYLWVSKFSSDVSPDPVRSTRKLLEALSTSGQHHLIFENDSAAIYGVEE